MYLDVCMYICTYAWWVSSGHFRRGLCQPTGFASRVEKWLICFTNCKNVCIYTYIHTTFLRSPPFSRYQYINVYEWKKKVLDCFGGHGMLAICAMVINSKWIVNMCCKPSRYGMDDHSTLVLCFDNITYTEIYNWLFSLSNCVAAIASGGSWPEVDLARCLSGWGCCMPLRSLEIGIQTSIKWCWEHLGNVMETYNDS